MLVRSPQREEEIAELALPTNVERLTRGETVHPMLADDCRPLELLWELDVSPQDLTVAPLWESPSDATGFAMRIGMYVKYDFHHPEDYEALGWSIHAVTADLLAWHWTEEAEDESLREVAELLEFPCIDEFLCQIEAANQEDAESQKEWERRFRASLP